MYTVCENKRKQHRIFTNKTIMVEKVSIEKKFLFYEEKKIAC